MRRPAGALATFLVLLAGSLVLLTAVFLPLWKPLLLAVVLAGALGGLQDRMSRRLRGRRKLSASLLLVGLVVVVVLPLTAIAVFAVKETIDGIQWATHLLQTRGIQGLVELAPDRAQPHLQQWLQQQRGGGYLEKLPAQGLAALGALGTALSTTGNLAFEAVMLLIALYFLLVDGPRLAAWLAEVSPLGTARTRELMGELRSTSGSVLISTVATAAVQGAVAALGFWLAGVPHVLFFAALTFFAAFIPSVGTSIVILPVAAYLLVAGRLGGAIFLAAWGLLVTGTIDNILKPVLARGGTEVHGGLVFFSMIGGIVLFGALGLVLGPISLSLILTLVRIGRREFAARTAAPAPEPPVPLPPAGGSHASPLHDA